MTTCMQLCGCPNIAAISRATVHDRGANSGTATTTLATALAAKEKEIAALREAVESLRESHRLAMQLLAKM